MQQGRHSKYIKHLAKRIARSKQYLCKVKVAWRTRFGSVIGWPWGAKEAKEYFHRSLARFGTHFSEQKSIHNDIDDLSKVNDERVWKVMPRDGKHGCPNLITSVQKKGEEGKIQTKSTSCFQEKVKHAKVLYRGYQKQRFRPTNTNIGKVSRKRATEIRTSMRKTNRAQSWLEQVILLITVWALILIGSLFVSLWHKI